MSTSDSDKESVGGPPKDSQLPGPLALSSPGQPVERPKQKHVAVPLTQAQAIIDFLKKRPYDEVALLIDSLLKSPEVML